MVAQICRRLQTSLSRSGRRLLIYSMFTSENYLNCRKLSRCQSRIRLEIFTPVVNGNVANCGSGQQFVCCSSGINHFRGCHLCPPAQLYQAAPTRYVHIGQIVAIQRAIRPYTAPLRWHRARHVFVSCGEAQRKARCCVEVSISLVRAPFSFWEGSASSYHRAYRTCKGTTKRGNLVPKVNWRISREWALDWR